MSWFTQQWVVYTPTGVSITDSPSAERDGGPDGSLAISVVITDAPTAIRHAGPQGSGIDVALATDSPSALRQYGPDGALAITTVLTDTPSALRSSGPDGAVAVGVTTTDSPSAERDYGPDGVAAIGVTFGPDAPTALRQYGPDGLVSPDLVVTASPGGSRSAGPDGSVALGLVLTDGPSAARFYGPVGAVQADPAGGVTLTDAPVGSRCSGSDGVLTLGIVFAGDSPSATRLGGPDGSLILGIVLTDNPSAERDGGPDGLVLAILSDTPGGARATGPDGNMGIALPLIGDLPQGCRSSGPTGVVFIGLGADVNAGTAAPSGSRFSGPDGQVLLAIITSKPPYVPAAPLIAPSYELWVADTRTGRMMWKLPADTFSWDTKLNDIGTMRATIILESFRDALSDQDERDPRILVREILTGPWRFSLVLKWGNNVVWAGPYLRMSRPTPSKVEVNAAEIGKIFSKRTLVKPGAAFATDTAADTVIGPYTTKQHAAAVLISQALAGVGNDLPISVTDPGGAGTDYRTYYGYDLSKYWDQLLALSSEVDGPEIRFDPRVTSGSDGDYLSWVAQIGTPHLGRNVTTWVFDSDVNSIVGFDGDGSSMAFGVWESGTGQSRDKLIAHTTDTSLLAIGWPMLETVDSSHSSETSYPVVAAHSAAALAAYKQPIVAFKASVPADSDPMVGTYHVGEDFSIDIHGDPVIPDGFYTRRIAALSGTEKLWVTITDTSPLPVGSV